MGSIAGFSSCANVVELVRNVNAARSTSVAAGDGWNIRRDGGVFDQFSGASITPRAVVETVHRGLGLFERNRSALLAPLHKGS